MRTRATILQPFTHQWLGTYAGAGNGKYREELQRALEALTRVSAGVCPSSFPDRDPPRRFVWQYRSFDRAVLWPVVHALPPAPASLLNPPAPLPHPPAQPAVFPILWRDWPRAHLRRHWLAVIRAETLDIARDATCPPAELRASPQGVLTRPQRAHWRLRWRERLARNARLSTAPSLTLHGLPTSFASAYGFALLEAA